MTSRPITDFPASHVSIGANTLARFGYVAVTCVFATIALSMADRSLPDVKYGTMPLILLVIAFYINVIGLTLASTAPKIQITLQMFCLYFSIFLILPGYHHSTANIFPFYSLSYNDYIRSTAAVIVILFCTVVIVSYNFFFGFLQKGSLVRQKARPPITKINLNTRLAVFFVLLSVAATVLVVATLGSQTFATRSTGPSSLNLGRSAGGLFVDLPRTIVSTTLIFAVVAKVYSRQQRFAIGMLAIMIVLYLIAVWPLGQARYRLFGFLLMVCFIVFNMSSVKARAMLSLGFVGGILLISPLYDSFTRGGLSVSEISLTTGLETYFTTGDYDGLQSINNAVIYTNGAGFQHGRQLLSAALFFVPRKMWPGKSENSGTLTAEAAGYSFTNISQPLPGEFYIDFGYTGLIVLGVILGFLFAKMDLWIEDNWSQGPKTRMIAGLIVGYSIILYRGALLGIISGVIIGVVGTLLIIQAGFKQDRRHAARDG